MKRISSDTAAPFVATSGLSGLAWNVIGVALGRAESARGGGFSIPWSTPDGDRFILSGTTCRPDSGPVMIDASFQAIGGEGSTAGSGAPSGAPAAQNAARHVAAPSGEILNETSQTVPPAEVMRSHVASCGYANSCLMGAAGFEPA